jgi:PAS domain S-box-containing protein
MRDTPRGRLIAYGVAVLAAGASLAIRWLLMPFLDHERPFITFFPAVILSAYVGGLGPGLVATFLGAALGHYYVTDPPYTFTIHDRSEAYALALYTLTGVVISATTESLHRSRSRVAANERRYAVTLASIGDAVIATDLQARVTYLNPAAEALTGWAAADAVGRPLAEVFRIVNQQTRRPAEDPAAGVLRSGAKVGLANNTSLLARDGREVPINDCGAPIVDDHGRIAGVVLVFRDVTRQRQAEEAEAFRRAGERMELAVRGSNVGVWDLELAAGDNHPARRHYVNVWEQLGYEGVPDDGENALSEAHPDDRKRFEEAVRRYMAGEAAALETEIRFRHKDGSYRTMLARGAAVRDATGKPIRLLGIGIDISKLKLAEEALRESEQRWRSLTEALPHLVWSAVPDGACDYFSTQWTDHTGVAEADLLGWRWLQTLHPEDQEPTRQFWLESVAGRHPYDVEYRVRRRDGEYRWFKTRGVPIRDGNGNIVKWFGTCTDITDLRQTEEALRASEHRFRTFVDHAADGFFLLEGGQFRVMDVNRRACESLGYSRDELIGMTPADFDRDLTPAAVETRIRRLEEGEAIAFESRHRRKDGSVFPVEVRGKAFREGGRQFLVTLVRDVTERNRAEEALRESEERFRGTFENAAVGIVHTHPTGQLLRVNEKFCAIVGRSREELLQTTFQDITHPDDLTASVGSLTELLRGEAPALRHEKRYLRKDGSSVWVELFTSLQRDAASRPAYAIAVIQDISERKRLDTELRRAKDVAEAANRAKDEFLANVSHEIRTPMNAILGMTELALETELSVDQRQCLKTVKSAADNLLVILNDLLDFAKIESGKMELDAAEFSLRAAVGDTLRALAVRAHKKGLELIYHVQPDVPDALVGDAGRLRQVLLNLVGNAVKFTDAGEVVVSLEREARSAGREEPAVALPPDGAPRSTPCAVRFTVRDTGIASRLVALMGGTVTVDSEPGRGSTFAFTARFGLQPHPPEPAEDPRPVVLQDLPVLVVDDNATNRHILEEFLRGWRMKPKAVADCVAAMDALWHGAACGRPYPLVLLDARMPDVDGLALAAKIRERAELSATRIVLLTSGDRPGELARLRELRVNAHLLKPLQQDELLETIYRVMSQGHGDAPPPASPPAQGGQSATPNPAAPSVRILVAEDNDFNAQLLEQLLGRRGHRVRLANNGREALRLIAGGGFDLLFLDLHMPEMDGFQVIQALREREQTAGGHLPVIALTARSRKEDRERCLAAGMDDFLAKPIQAVDLWAAIDRAVGRRPGADRPPADLLDPRVLLAACGGDAAILEKICQAFRSRLPDHLRTVQDALRDRDASGLREAAHKLAGMVAAFSTVAGGVASELEDKAAQGRLEEARPLAERLETMSGELMRLAGGLSVEALRDQTR